MCVYSHGIFLARKTRLNFPTFSRHTYTFLISFNFVCSDFAIDVCTLSQRHCPHSHRRIEKTSNVVPDVLSGVHEAGLNPQ